MRRRRSGGSLRSENGQIPTPTFTHNFAKLYIRASIEEVAHTFVEALLLVVFVIFVFLQSWRATLIPLLAVPVSLIGTFAAFIVLGFSINTLTLFAMVLAIGLVVDDA
ncbi:MAG: efflux RND transporter permease subunit, partial [Prevotella sp.]|nr:efflux RND transporter permease subunit [Prevotella sp.]